MLVFSFFVFGFAIWVNRRFGRGRYLGLALLVLVPVWVVLTSLEVGLSAITGEGLNDAVFYHMKTGLGGGDVTQYAGQIIAGLLALGVVVGATFWMRRHIHPQRSIARIWGNLVVVALLALVFVAHPVPRATAAYLMRFQSVTQLTEGFYTPEITTGTGQRGKNLILLYLESTERTYADQDRFDNLMPNLMAIEPRSIHFTDLSQTIGTGFTIGGMVASQCGSPLILSGGENSMQVNRFLAGATCLGDLLAQQGYDLNYLGGAALEFAGKGAFYETHGYQSVQGLEQLLPTTPDPSYRAEWGLQDDTLFDLARQKLDQLAAQDRPFVLTMLTLDTHHPHGHGETNRACTDVRYQDGSNKLLNSVMCDDKLAAEFVQDVIDGPLGPDTVVVVMSDHLALGNDATDILNSGPRRNLAMIFDPDTPQGQRVDRPGTTLDMGPTILSVMGYGVDRMGFGVDLLGSVQTLPEELGVAADDKGVLDQHLLGYQSTYARLWDYPDLGQGLSVDLAGPTAILGETHLGAPLLAEIGDAGGIDNVSLYDARAETGLVAQFLNLDDGARFLWIDRCDILQNLSANIFAAATDDLCLATGRKAEVANVQLIAPGSTFDAETLLAGFDRAKDGKSAEQLDAFRGFGQSQGALPYSLSVSGIDNEGRGVLLHSARFGSSVPSLIRRRTNDGMVSGEDWFVPRGLSLVGFDKSGRAEFLSTFDTCGENPTPDTRPWMPILNARWADFSDFAILAHDSGYCGADATTMDPILEGLDLPALRQLQMRQPYIAVIEKDGTAHEYQNGDAEMVRVYLEPTVSQPAVTVRSGPVFAGGAEPAHTAQSPVAVTSAPVVSAASEAVVVASPDASNGAQEAAKAHEADPAVACIQQTEPSNPPKRQPIAADASFIGPDIEAVVDFGPDWWPAEPFGRWASSKTARLQVTNAMSTPADLYLKLVPYLRDSTVFEVAIGGQVFDVAVASGTELRIPLPSSFDGEVTLTRKDNDPINCPASLDRGADFRNLTFMLQAVRVEANTDAATPKAMISAPFTPAIAHGGGKLGGEAITDSLTALDGNLGAFETFELDFNWTTDGKLVCIHDWEDAYRYRSGGEQDGPVPYADFIAMLDNTPERPRNCDLQSLGQWMTQNAGARIVTDAKEDAVAVNDLIATTFPALRDRIVPQAYQPAEIQQYRDQGYQSVIWTLYEYGGSDADVMTEVESRRPEAVTMPIDRALGSTLVADLADKFGTPVYVHTVNDTDLAACLKSIGVAGIYSDTLGLLDWQSLPQVPESCMESFK